MGREWWAWTPLIFLVIALVSALFVLTYDFTVEENTWPKAIAIAVLAMVIVPFLGVFSLAIGIILAIKKSKRRVLKITNIALGILIIFLGILMWLGGLSAGVR